MLKEFQCNSAPICHFEPYWFNCQEYINFYPLDVLNSRSFSFQKGQHEIILSGFLKGQQFQSPYRAPFGGLDFSESVDREQLHEFTKEVIRRLSLEGIKQLNIVAPPECYDLDKADLMDEVLLHCGFSISQTDFNYHLPVNEIPFVDLLHDSEKRRLKKCLEQDFMVVQENLQDYSDVHRLISTCRERKGFPISMTLNDFESVIKKFPNRYKVFSVFDKGKRIATAVGIVVNSNILYNFLPADDEAYSSFSPIVLLNKGIYDYCQQQNMLVYDLGIASAKGERNEGLIKFKEHLGGQLSHKYSYQLLLT